MRSKFKNVSLLIMILLTIKLTITAPMNHHHHQDHNNNSIEEQLKLIQQSNDQLHFHLAEGRSNQVLHAKLGKLSENNKNLSNQKISKIGKKMNEIHNDYMKNVGNWLENDAIKQTAIPNKNEKPFYLQAKQTKDDLDRIRNLWLNKEKWPNSSMNYDHLSHQSATANEVREKSFHNLTSAKRKV